MTHVHINLDVAADPWPDLQDRGLVNGVVERVGRLRSGMGSGRSSVAFVVRLEDGNALVGEMSMDHFLAAAAACHAREQMEGLRP